MSDIVVPIVEVHHHMDRDFRLPPPHMARRLGDQPFYHPPLLWDTIQYIGHRIPGRETQFRAAY